ncbi:4'-phosphopantetheinyl transferase superfamily protein [Asaia astilbis]|uniref:4'-phosphopantetheinyl transferase superfamily protein n=1 Tax=Asaia astilbis TaxID=610244 RepID=UPI0035709B5C
MGSAEDRLTTTCSSCVCFERAFSAKEAAFKAFYPIARRLFEFQDVEIVSARADGPSSLQLLRDLDRPCRAGSTDATYHAALNKVDLSITGVPKEA